MRRVASIVTALCVLLSSAYCACAAATRPEAARHVHACCDHGGKFPARPGHPHDPAPDCPHCDGSAVTAAPQQAHVLPHVSAALPALACDAMDAALAAPTDRIAPTVSLPVTALLPLTLLGLHCALTL